MFNLEEAKRRCEAGASAMVSSHTVARRLVFDFANAALADLPAAIARIEELQTAMRRAVVEWDTMLSEGGCTYATAMLAEMQGMRELLAPKPPPQPDEEPTDAD